MTDWTKRLLVDVELEDYDHWCQRRPILKARRISCNLRENVRSEVRKHVRAS